MATHHDKQTAKGLCKRAIEGQTNNPLSHVFLFFNSLIAQTVYESYSDLRKMNDTKSYAEALMNSMLCGGFSMGKTSSDYAQYLLDAFGEFDRIPYEISHTDELQKIFEKNADQAKT